VAEKYNLNDRNCPTHPSFCREDWIRKAMNRGVQFYYLLHQNEMIGCVALEEAGAGLGYLERLAVLPEYQKNGYGSRLVRYVLEEAIRRGLDRVSIAVIAEQSELSQWYERRGFLQTEVRHFEHLPFNVRFMEIKL